MAHYVVKRHFKFHKDPFFEFFRHGVQCWIPLNVGDLVDFEFVARPVENENEKQEIHEKMKKYLELKILKSFKRKKKRAAWKERMKIISDEKALNKKKKKQENLRK